MTPSRTLLALAALALLLAGAGCDTDEENVDPEPLLPENALYVPNQADATISVLSTADNALVRTLDLTEYGFSAEAKPHHVVVEPDGSAFYVSLIGANVVAKFSRAAELAGTASVNAPGMMTLDADGDRLYVTHTMSIVDVPSTVAVIGRGDMTLANGGEPVEVGIDRPHGTGVHPDGGVVYVGSLSENRLAAIDTETQAVQIVDQGGGDVQRYVHFVLSSDGKRLYATGQTAGTLRTFDVSDPLNPTLRTTTDVNPAPWHPVLSDDDARLYFGNKGANTVTALDTGTGAVTVIEGDGLAQPHGSALSPDGRFLYVSNQNQNGTYAAAGENGTVVVIDTQTNEIAAVVEVGRKPAGLGARQ